MSYSSTSAGDLHRRAGERVADDLVGEPSVSAVLLSGSVARGEHLPVSDVDLLVVRDDVAPVRRVVDGLLVECVSHSERDWMVRFDRPKTSWLYAFLDAEIIRDTDGAGQRLKALAEQVRQRYVASDQLRRRLATMLWHGQAKLARAASQDSMSQGFWAAVCAETIIDGLYTIHDVPLPAGSRRLAYLDAVPLLPDERALLHQYLMGSTAERFRALMRLAGYLSERLGPADHED